MDGQQFDSIARSIALSINRRRVLAGLAGGVAGALGLVCGQRGVAAARGRQCPIDNTTAGCNKPCRMCCDGRCVYACPDATAVCNASSGQCVSREDYQTPVDPVCP
jgi:hypothetical protein